MQNVDVLIIGGGVAGTTAAETYRNGGGTGSVLIVTDEPDRLYSRVLLPHAIKGKIDPMKVFLKTEGFYKEKGIDLLTDRAVSVLEPKKKAVVLDDGTEIGFGKLVIAVGGKPRAWDVRGTSMHGVFRLQTYVDARRIVECTLRGNKIAIVGSGFIALEFAAIAMAREAEAVILNRGPRFWTSMLGPATAAAVEAALAKQGVKVRNGVKVARLLGDESVFAVELSTGERVEAFAVGIGIGLEVPVGPFGDMKGEHGIRTNAFLETSHEGIWAAGDCAEFEDELLGGLRHAVGNWTNAVAQGRHVGQALLGQRAPFKTLTQYTTSCVPGLNLIFIGETKIRPGAAIETKELAPGKMVEYHLLDGRVIGAILMNCPELRVEAIARITAGKP